MWIEARLLPTDLERIVGQLTPLTIPVGEGHLRLFDPSSCTLVPDVGLRIVCAAQLDWPVLGMELPVKARSLAVVIRPMLVRRGENDVLVFKASIDAADLEGVLGLMDHPLANLANKELLRKEVELAWDFAKTLTHSFDLPASMVPLDSIGLWVREGRLHIGADALVLGVRLVSTIKRHAIEAGEGEP